MDALLKSFSIGFLLRCVFSGGFFVLSYRVASLGTPALSEFESTGLFALALPMALFAGVTVYGLHRSLVYPIIELGMNSSVAKALRAKAPLISKPTITLLLQQWDRAAEEDKRDIERAKHISTWGDFAHLQYASGLCIALGSMARVVSVSAKYEVSWLLVCLASVFFIAALLADWRLHAIQDNIGSPSAA